jgi:hypothetical protein
MLSSQVRLGEELRKYGVELRKLAYRLPDGVGEHDLLYLSGRMIFTAWSQVQISLVSQLPSGRYRALYCGPDGRGYKAPTTFATEQDARDWLARVAGTLQRLVGHDPEHGGGDGKISARTV